MAKPQDKNVLGTALQVCSLDPLTGFSRTGCCETGADDMGSHTVCAQMTDEFLAFSISPSVILGASDKKSKISAICPTDINDIIRPKRYLPPSTLKQNISPGLT